MATWIEAGMGTISVRIEMPDEAGRQLALLYFRARHREDEGDPLAGMSQDEADKAINDYLVRTWGRHLREVATAEAARQASRTAEQQVEDTMGNTYGTDQVVIIGPTPEAEPVAMAL